jgi:Uma2 family endonuclease
MPKPNKQTHTETVKLTGYQAAKLSQQAAALAVANEPEPDLMLFQIGAATRAHHVRPADVFLVVEVSLSTRDKDLSDKVMIYERGRIPEYWVINLDKDCLRAFTLEGDHYRRKTFKHGRVPPQAFPGVMIDLDCLLGAEE